MSETVGDQFKGLDLHLHPKWQKCIVEDLKRTFPKCQLIISTHSPFIIQSVNAEELFDINEMQFADEKGMYSGWSIDMIQEEIMGGEKKTPILPKSLHPELVVEWENLFPTCLRCDREKNDCDEILLNPCENEPKEYLALSWQNPFWLKGIDSQGVGKKTILAIGLNNLDRVMVERLSQWKDIHQKLEEIYEDLQDYGL